VKKLKLSSNIRNNLIHFSLALAILASMFIMSATNGRYSTNADLSGTVNFLTEASSENALNTHGLMMSPKQSLIDDKENTIEVLNTENKIKETNDKKIKNTNTSKLQTDTIKETENVIKTDIIISNNEEENVISNSITIENNKEAKNEESDNNGANELKKDNIKEEKKEIDKNINVNEKKDNEDKANIKENIKTNENSIIGKEDNL